jgi:hypothetical protein
VEVGGEPFAGHTDGGYGIAAIDTATGAGDAIFAAGPYSAPCPNEATVAIRESFRTGQSLGRPYGDGKLTSVNAKAGLK